MSKKSIFVKILLAPLAWLIQACSPLGKPVNPEVSDNFYYNKSKTDIIYSSMGNWFELGKASLNADVASFKVLNHHIGKDKNRAYYREHAITDPDLDLESFRASTDDWMWHIGMDKNRVYSLGHDVIDGEWKLIMKIVEGADPATFKQYDSYWSKDARKHFYNYKPISVDYNSFELVNDTFAKDSNSIYLHYQGDFRTLEGEASSFVKMDRYHARDAENVYYFIDYQNGAKVGIVRKIPFNNEGSLKVLENYYLVADDSVYYRGIKLGEADASAFEALGETYGKDGKHIYYQDELIEEADAATFHYDEKEYVYRDKNHKYRGAEIWEQEKNENTRED